ncbi:MAG: hypothetical protein CML24_11680 [Rhizobiales bacterium]|nr:hypothetical protein [Hyphomicrobiales bacterium]|tara:strand:- start:4487 stop:4927 length:441 start_codon:yes stop_codon:yes gene_type:complete
MGKSKLEALLERVEKATGPNYNLEVEIAYVTGFWPEDRIERVVRSENGAFTVWFSNDGPSLPLPPNSTASIDAALALVERVLPGWTHGHQKFPDGEVFNSGGYQFFVAEDDADLDSGYASGEAPTLPLAVLAAMLKALIAQEAANG